MGRDKVGLRVVLVEDDPDVQRSMKGILVMADYEVECASTVEEGKALLTRPAHALITDIFLPDGEGLEVVRSIADHLRPTIVIAMSGLADASRGFELAHLAVDHFLTKPIDPAELLAILSGAQKRPLPLGPVAATHVGITPLRDAVDEVRTSMVETALEQSCGNRAQAGRLLGVSRQALSTMKDRDE